MNGLTVHAMLSDKDNAVSDMASQITDSIHEIGMTRQNLHGPVHGAVFCMAVILGAADAVFAQVNQSPQEEHVRGMLKDVSDVFESVLVSAPDVVKEAAERDAENAVQALMDDVNSREADKADDDLESIDERLDRMIMELGIEFEDEESDDDDPDDDLPF